MTYDPNDDPMIFIERELSGPLQFLQYANRNKRISKNFSCYFEEYGVFSQCKF